MQASTEAHAVFSQAVSYNTAMSEELYIGLSEKLKSKIRTVDSPEAFQLDSVKNGLVAIHADWSGYSVAYGRSILRILDGTIREDIDIYVLDINAFTVDDQKEKVGLVSHGYFEGLWIENGMVAGRHEYGNGPEGFNQFKELIIEKTAASKR